MKKTATLENPSQLMKTPRTPKPYTPAPARKRNRRPVPVVKGAHFPGTSKAVPRLNFTRYAVRLVDAQGAVSFLSHRAETKWCKVTAAKYAQEMRVKGYTATVEPA